MVTRSTAEPPENSKGGGFDLPRLQPEEARRVLTWMATGVGCGTGAQPSLSDNKKTLSESIT